MNDILLAKVVSILKCLKRVQEDFESENTFRTYITKQDAVVLNLQRACEASIDIANHIVKEKRLRLPKPARESFELLSKNELIQAEIALRMRNLIGFRNIAIHYYQALNLDIVVNIVLHRLDDFKDFVSEVDNKKSNWTRPTQTLK